jgi:hypothetical protein
MAHFTLELEGLKEGLRGSLRLLLKPVIDHVPRQALAMKLDQTRQATSKSPEWIAAGYFFLQSVKS